jgi:hypothetical protein
MKTTINATHRVSLLKERESMGYIRNFKADLEKTTMTCVTTHKKMLFLRKM